MTKGRSRRYLLVDGFLVAVVLATAGLGLWLDVSSDVVAAPRAAAPATPFPGRHTLFCPPPPAPQAASTLALAAPSGDAAIILDPGRGLGKTLEREGMAVVRRRAAGPTNIGSRGSRVVAEASFTVEDGSGRGSAAAGCSAEAATSWYFAQGSSTLDAEEDLVLYNPYPDEAVARITLFTPAGQQLQANLDDVAVPSRGTVSLRVNDYLLVGRSLSASVEALRGRLVAWKTVAEDGTGARDPAMHSTLGATRTSATWYLPEAGAGAEADGRISLLNPSSETAVVDISLYRGRQSELPPGLEGIEIAPLSSTVVALDTAVSGIEGPDHFGAMVQSINGVQVVAEGTVAYDSQELQGVASELAADRAATRLSVGAGSKAASDDTVIVLNPGSKGAHVAVTLLRPGTPPATPDRLSDVMVGRGSRRAFSVAQWSNGRPSTVILDSDNPIVAERRSYGGIDVTRAMGAPLSDRRRGDI